MKFDKFQLNLFAPAETVGGGSTATTATNPPKEIKTMKTAKTKTTTKTAKTPAKPEATKKPQPKPSAVKSVKTAKGHTLAAVKDGKLVKIAECVREDATAAKPKREAVKAKPKPSKPAQGAKEAAKPAPKPPKASGPAKAAPAAPAAPQPPKPPKPQKPAETFRDMIARHFRERQAVAPLWIKPPAPDAIPTPSGWIPRAKLAALVALKARQAKEHHAAIMGRPAEVFAEVLDMFKGDPRAALFAVGITFHDDRGDGRLHVPLFGCRRPVLEAWKKVAVLKGYKFAAESVGA